MKERPILFSAPMVRALLAGTKTQTRRVVKPLPEIHEIEQIGPMLGFKKRSAAGFWLWPNATENILAECPFGTPGDRLWVRESWRTVWSADEEPPRSFDARYRYWYEADVHHQDGYGKLRPSIHMPRAACRLVLEITCVRVERLQQITEADAGAEGCAPSWLDADDNETVHAHAQPTYRQGFARLWRDINGPDSWGANPWVWVVEFRRLP